MSTCLKNNWWDSLFLFFIKFVTLKTNWTRKQKNSIHNIEIVVAHNVCLWNKFTSTMCETSKISLQYVIILRDFNFDPEIGWNNQNDLKTFRPEFGLVFGFNMRLYGDFFVSTPFLFHCYLLFLTKRKRNRKVSSKNGSGSDFFLPSPFDQNKNGTLL